MKTQRGNAELGIIVGAAALSAIFWRIGLAVGLTAAATGCAGFKVYAGVERVDQVETKQVTNDESFLCKMGYCDRGN